jgi:hypothetical protein
LFFNYNKFMEQTIKISTHHYLIKVQFKTVKSNLIKILLILKSLEKRKKAKTLLPSNKKMKRQNMMN